MDQIAMDDIQAYCLSQASEPFWIQEITNIRWPSGFECPSCGNQHAYKILTRRLPLYECSSCYTQTSLSAGTIMEGSRTPLRLWILAMFLHSRPQSINATNLAAIIGTTYKTAWLICHKIRHAMANADNHELLKGLVRINFAQYGRPYNPTIYRHPQEHPLLVGGTIDGQGEFTHIKIKQADEECSYPQFTCPLNKFPFIHKHVDPQATEIIAVTLKYSRERNRKLLHICQMASNWINITFQGIGAKHLQAYLDQYCYSYNIAMKQQHLFPHLIKMCLKTPTLTYPNLINKPNTKPKLLAQYRSLLKNAS